MAGLPVFIALEEIAAELTAASAAGASFEFPALTISDVIATQGVAAAEAISIAASVVSEVESILQGIQDSLQSLDLSDIPPEYAQEVEAYIEGIDAGVGAFQNWIASVGSYINAVQGLISAAEEAMGVIYQLRSELAAAVEPLSQLSGTAITTYEQLQEAFQLVSDCASAVYGIIDVAQSSLPGIAGNYLDPGPALDAISEAFNYLYNIQW